MSRRKREHPNTAKAIPEGGRAVSALTGFVVLLSLSTGPIASAQTPPRWKAHDMDRPRPPVVNSSLDLPVAPPSDAVVLFDGGDLSQWRSQTGGPAKWIVRDGYMESVKGSGYVYTRASFGDIQLHLEWAAPLPAAGTGQGRGNSGIHLMGLYEVQILDSYENITYADGQAASVYGQHPPLFNASRPPGEWQSFDIVFRRPRFKPDGRLVRPARVTLFHNGILVQDNVEIWGPTSWLQHRPYESHPERLPLSLQDHGNPVRYRNIWLRELPEWTEPGPAGPATKPLVTLAPEVLDRYTGKYKDRPQAAFTISREGSRLYLQFDGLQKLELLTDSSDEFSLRWTAGRLAFELDPRGVPTAFTFHIGGAALRAKKVE